MGTEDTTVTVVLGGKKENKKFLQAGRADNGAYID